MPIDLVLPLSMIMCLTAFGVIAKWYVIPLLNKVNTTQALIPLLLLNTFRFVGLAFLIPGVTSASLDPRFSSPAAYGDLLAALLAFLGIIALRQAWRISIPLVWLFNVVGLLDLLIAVSLGLRFTEDGHLGATFFIPAIIVPALIVTHIMVFIILLRNEQKPADV
jgi:hypothetical protein